MFRGEGRTRWLHAGLVAALVASSSAALAHAQSATGSIEGLVVDQSGAVLSGVTIAILQSATGVRRDVVTDGNGIFRAPLLPVGVYDLTATLEGFQARKQTDVRLTVAQTVTLRLVMGVAGIAQAVTVLSETPVIERSRTHVSSTVNETAIQNLPVNGRNFIDFVLLTPGVARDARTGDISFAGQRGTLTSLVVDGADNNNTFFGQSMGRTGSGRAPYQFSQDAVKEFQVNSNAFLAEYGRGGGVIHVVTKSGTNELHGSAFEFYRDKALNATNVINVLNNLPKGAYHYHQFGGTLGGPLRINRDFFFFNYDGQRNRQSNPVFLNLPPNTPGDPATTAAIERLRPLAYSWNRTLDQDVFLIKTDHQLGTSHRLTSRYNHQDFTGEGYETGATPQNTFEHTGDSLVMTRTLNASWAGALRRSLLNELRFQYARDQEPGEANSDNPEAFVQEGTATTVLVIGRNPFSPRENTIDRVQMADTLTWIRGTHYLKTGFDLQFDRIRNVFPGFFGGSYRFLSLASFTRGRPDGAGESYQQSFAGPRTSGAETRPNIQEYSLFVQDEWKPRSDVTLNLGLRYDVMKTDAPSVRNPDPQLAAADIDTSRLEPDINNLGPRVGIAWSPIGRPYVVRGGWGLFYGRTPSILLAAAGSSNGINIVSLTFTGESVPTYPQRFTEIPSDGSPVRPHIFYVDKDFASPRLMQANAAFEWELVRGTSLTVTYLFVDGTDLPRPIDRNLGSLVARTFTIAGSAEAESYPFFLPGDRPFARFQRVIAFESSAESRYNGVTFELNRRFARDLQFRVAYTLGQVIDTAPDASGVVPGIAVDDAKFASNPADFETDRTVGNNDQRHRLVASGVYGSNHLSSGLEGLARALASGWSLSAILAAQSGQPYSARVGVDLNGDGNTRNDLAPGTRRNQFRLPAIVTLDVRIGRDIPLAGRGRVQLIWEAFNLFNRDNINSVAPGYYSLTGTTLLPNPAFGRPMASAGERIMQLAVKVTF